MPKVDYISQRIQEVGLLVLAALTICGLTVLLISFKTGNTVDPGILALVAGSFGTVLGFFFSKGASAQGAQTTNGTTSALADIITRSLLTPSPGQQTVTQTVTTPELPGHPSTTMTSVTAPVATSGATGPGVSGQ